MIEIMQYVSSWYRKSFEQCSRITTFFFCRTMVILKNVKKIFFDHEFIGSYLKDKEPDCDLYSKEGFKFSIHKEMIYPTILMKNILSNSDNFCNEKIEIFCHLIWRKKMH